MTLTIDAAQADLLLEAEIGRFADPDPTAPPGVRRFRVSPPSLRRAAEQGYAVADIDTWFAERTGVPLSPAGRLFLLAPQMPPPSAGPVLVVRFATPEATDGVMQWPATAGLIRERLGPTAVAVDDEDLEPLRRVLAEVGLSLSDDGPSS